MKIISSIKAIFSSALYKLLYLALEILKSLVEYLVLTKKSKIKEKEQKEQKEFESKVDQVVDNGTIDDLLDLKRN